MAKKDLAGQINMFDVFRELEKSAEAAGEVEMVSLMPEREPVGEIDVEIADEQVVLEKPEVKFEIADKKAKYGEIKTESLNADEETEHEKVETKSVEVEESKPDLNDIRVESKIVDCAEQNDTGIDKLSNEKIEEKFVNVNGSEIKNNSDVAMHREKRDVDGNIVAEIFYINYNKVLIRRKGHEDILKSFDNSYDAVDYYVSNMRLDNF